jgi:glycosyltransferase involved in cell wall biosynthesis
MIKESKPKLLIFSQCFIYGGSERLMQSIFKNKFVLDEYDIIFSFSYFKDYLDGVKRDNANQDIKARIAPLFLLTNGDVFYKIDLAIKNKWLKIFLKLPLFLVEKAGLYALWNYIFLFAFIAKTKPNVVHINNGGYPAAPACNELAILMSFFPKINVVYQVNNKAYPKKGWRSRLLDTLVNRGVNLFMTHSVQNKEALVEKRGFSARKTASIPSYFEETILNSGLSKQEITGGKFNLCMVGFLSHRKGQLYLLKALLLIKQQYPDIYIQVSLNLVGDGERRFELREFIEDNQLIDAAVLWGKRDDYIQFIHHCDLFMLTSVEGEDLPLVLLTAMQLKKCIVASSFAGITDLLTNEQDAILVQPNTKTIAEEVAAIIVRLFNDSDKRHSLSEKVSKTYHAKLGEESYGKNLLEMYNLPTPR